jgi:hypothetical protein
MRFLLQMAGLLTRALLTRRCKSSRPYCFSVPISRSQLICREISDFKEKGSAQIGPGEIGPLEISPEETGSLKVNATEVRSAKIDATEVDANALPNICQEGAIERVFAVGREKEF